MFIYCVTETIEVTMVFSIVKACDLVHYEGCGELEVRDNSGCDECGERTGWRENSSGSYVYKVRG